MKEEDLLNENTLKDCYYQSEFIRNSPIFNSCSSIFMNEKKE